MEKAQVFNYKNELNALMSLENKETPEVKSKFQGIVLLKKKLATITSLMNQLTSNDLSSALFCFMVESNDNIQVLTDSGIAVINGTYSVDQRNSATIQFFKKLKNEKDENSMIFYNINLLPINANTPSLSANISILTEIHAIFNEVGVDKAIGLFGAWLSTAHHTTQQLFTRCMVDASIMILNTQNEDSEVYMSAKRIVLCSQNLAFAYI